LAASGNRPGLMGLTGVDRMGTNNNHAKWILTEIVPDDNNGVVMKVLSPGQIATLANPVGLPIPPWGDRECFPNCPSCFDDICSKNARNAQWTVLVVFVLSVFIGGYYWCIGEDENFGVCFMIPFRPLYSVLEIVCAYWALQSDHYFRPGQELIDNETMRSLTHACICIDGYGGALGLAIAAAVRSGRVDEDKDESKIVLNVITAILFAGNTVLVGIYSKYLFSSFIPSRDTAPFSLDMILSTIECILTLNIGLFTPTSKKAQEEEEKKN